jgi:hypothetical protein
VTLPAGIIVMVATLAGTPPNDNTVVATQLEQSEYCPLAASMGSDPRCRTFLVGTAAGVVTTTMSKGCDFRFEVEFDDAPALPADVKGSCDLLHEGSQVGATWWKGRVVTIRTPDGRDDPTPDSPLPQEQGRRSTRGFGLFVGIVLLVLTLMGIARATFKRVANRQPPP